MWHQLPFCTVLPAGGLSVLNTESGTWGEGGDLETAIWIPRKAWQSSLEHNRELPSDSFLWEAEGQNLTAGSGWWAGAEGLSRGRPGAGLKPGWRAQSRVGSCLAFRHQGKELPCDQSATENGDQPSPHIPKSAPPLLHPSPTGQCWGPAPRFSGQAGALGRPQSLGPIPTPAPALA